MEAELSSTAASDVHHQSHLTSQSINFESSFESGTTQPSQDEDLLLPLRDGAGHPDVGLLACTGHRPRRYCCLSILFHITSILSGKLTLIDITVI